MSDTLLDHKALVASLDDEQRLKLTAKSDIAGLLNLATHIAGLAVTGSWIVLGWPLWQVAMVLHGLQLVFLFTLLHETVHFTPFKTPWINQAVGWACGFLILLPPLWFRYFHLAHHRYTHEPGKDPELDGPPIETLPRYLWTITGIPVWRFHIGTMFRNATGSFEYAYLPDAAHGRVTREARIMLVLYTAIIAICIALNTLLLVYLWIIPLVLGQPFLRLYLMAEHGRCPHVANMLENTRTTYTTRAMRWLAWNMPYHIEHHAYPSVPFHQLPEFHKVAKVHLQTTENGYGAFHAKEINHLQSSG